MLRLGRSSDSPLPFQQSDLPTPSLVIRIAAQWSVAGFQSGAHSSAVCPGFTPGSLFTRVFPQAPNLAAKIQQNVNRIDKKSKKTLVRIAAGQSLNKQINYGKYIRLLQSLVIIIQSLSILNRSFLPAHAPGVPARQEPSHSCRRQSKSGIHADRYRRG